MKRNDEIVIYTNPETLRHKQNKRYSLNRWALARPPAQPYKVKRIYFAIEGRVQGSFEVGGWGYHALYLRPKTWRKCRYKIMIKQFRGFRYRWW